MEVAYGENPKARKQAEQKSKILKYEKYETITEEEMKKEKYNIDDIFKKNKENIIKDIKSDNENNMLVLPQKQKKYKKILYKILKFFNIM